ncbi:MAG: hypothetical protein ACREPS_04505 [Rhodanobacteraceae bacterium]
MLNIHVPLGQAAAPDVEISVSMRHSGTMMAHTVNDIYRLDIAVRYDARRTLGCRASTYGSRRWAHWLQRTSRSRFCLER